MLSRRPGMLEISSIPSLIAFRGILRAKPTPVALRMFSRLCFPTMDDLNSKSPSGVEIFPTIPVISILKCFGHIMLLFE